MGPRRTAIVPKMIWGTAIASIVPSQLVACGGATSEPGPSGQAGSGQASNAGQTGSAGQAGRTITLEGYSGYTVLAVKAFGGAGPALGGTGGSEVMLAGAGGSAAGTGGSAAGAGGSAGKGPGAENGGFFIVLAAAAFGGKSQ